MRFLPLIVLAMVTADSAQALMIFSSSSTTMDGGTVFHSPRFVADDGRKFHVTFSSANAVCAALGLEHVGAFEMKTALWGAYEVVQVEADGSVHETAPAATVLRNITCYSEAAINAFKFGRMFDFAPFPLN